MVQEISKENFINWFLYETKHKLGPMDHYL
jgi:hypothetical protein